MQQSSSVYNKTQAINKTTEYTAYTQSEIIPTITEGEKTIIGYLPKLSKIKTQVIILLIFIIFIVIF